MRLGYACSGFVVALAVATTPALCRGQIATYTFDGTQFPLNASTPFLNAPPNTGPGTFTTSFAATPGASFQVTMFSPAQPLITGQALVNGTASNPAHLLLTFSQPVYSLRVNFAVQDNARIDLVTPAGTASQPAGNVGGAFAGGTLQFDSAVPFATADLAGFSATNTLIRSGFDNLSVSLSPVPEPASALLAAAAFAGVLAKAAARRRALVTGGGPQ